MHLKCKIEESFTPSEVSSLSRGVHSAHRVDFGSRLLGRFKIGLFVHIDSYIILNSYECQVKTGLVIRSGKLRVIEFILNTYISENELSNGLISTNHLCSDFSVVV